MSKHWVLLLCVVVVLAACERSARLAVRTTVTEGGDTTALTQLQVRLLPYDRDSIFSAFEQRAERPEPDVPADLLELRDSIAEAQSAWRDAEAAWSEVRDELQNISNRLEGMDRSSNEYFQLFQRFQDLETEESRLSRQQETTFDRFTELQSRYSTRADSFKNELIAWENRTFEGVGEAVDSLLEARGEQEYADTTGADGWAQLQLPPGEWWVHTRWDLPYEELYWNVAVQLESGANDTLILSNENAELRPTF